MNNHDWLNNLDNDWFYSLNCKFSKILSYNSIEETFLSIPDDCYVITDENVYRYYSAWIDNYKHIVIKSGEEYKNLETVNNIYGWLLENGCNRSSMLVGVGGGIVTDITGYVASTYMRGIKFGFIPTTLLAMIDASFGGKNGVNFNNYKNIIGCFNHPLFICICTDFLDTLDKREYSAGFGEVLKYAIGFNGGQLYKLLFEKKSIDNIGKKDLKKIIKECLIIKKHIIEEDEKESGVRKKLNLGHTLAHAIEKYTHKYMHGEAVYIGLVYIVKYAYKYGKLPLNQYQSIMSLLENKYKLCDYSDLNIKDCIEYISKDKKTGVDNNIDIIIPTSIGKCYVETKEIENFIDDLL